MKIPIVTNGFPPTAYGGVEIYSHNLARALDERDYSVQVFCRESDAELADYTLQREEVDGINVVRVINDFKRLGSFSDTYSDAEVDEIFNQLLLEYEPDLVHFNHLIALSANLPRITSSHDIPIITTLHDYWSFCHRVHLQDWRRLHCGRPRQGGDCFRCVIQTEKRRSFLRRILRWGRAIINFPLRQKIRGRYVKDAASIIALTGVRTDFDHRTRLFQENLGLSAVVFVPSQFVQQSYWANGYDDLEMRVLPLGVEAPESVKQHSQIAEGITLGYVGTIVPGKGAHILVEAFRQWADENAELNLYGRYDVDVGYTRRLRKIVDDDHRVHFMGSFDPSERDAIYKRIDYLVIPSIVPESFSLVAREAIIRGVPVIAADIGALPELISHKQNGYLFPPGDTQRLTEILRGLSENGGLFESLASFESDRLLSMEQHIEVLEQAYREAVRNSP